MSEIMSLALLERGNRTLLARRKSDQPPFAGQWLLPGALVGGDESAEEALERHTEYELGVEIASQEFAETLYLEDESANKRYVANVFRVRRRPGDLRFRAAGEYEDVRWLMKDELSAVTMPAALAEWLGGARQSSTPPVAPMPVGESAPDNRVAWNTISRAYQDRYQIPTDRLLWGVRCPDERELNLLGDVAGLRVLVLGCGGGQDCVVLAKQGAHVIGIDLSDKQIEYARRLADREGVSPTLLQGNAELLKGIDDESQDLVVSLHAMNYVERAGRAFGEAFRVLRRGGAFAFSAHHPFHACLEDSPPYGIENAYWQREADWQWDFPEANARARMRSWYRPVSEWFALLTDAGFRVERLIEPPATDEADPWSVSYDLEKMRLVPANLIIKAVKP